MAKTNIQHGYPVPEAFMDSIYLTDGGHKHDGVDDDGHSSKIDPVNHVIGVAEGVISLTYGTNQFTEEKTGLLYWRKHDAITGGFPAYVQLIFKAVSGTSNSDFLAPSGTPLVDLKPKRKIRINVPIIDNAADYLGTLAIETDGSISFGVSPAVEGTGHRVSMTGIGYFRNPGEKGYTDFFCNYPIFP